MNPVESIQRDIIYGASTEYFMESSGQFLVAGRRMKQLSTERPPLHAKMTEQPAFASAPTSTGPELVYPTWVPPQPPQYDFQGSNSNISNDVNPHKRKRPRLAYADVMHDSELGKRNLARWAKW